MKNLTLTLLIVVSLTWGCTPSDPAPKAVEATPTAVDDEITEMDFESGEVEQPAAQTEEPTEEPTPEAP